jgi:photosystem II stability/assembly factor-like uncharacterized protein
MIRISFVCLWVLLTATLSCQQAFWKKLNGPKAGTVNCIAANKNGDVYVGTSKGIFRSSDHGETWIHTSALLGLLNAKSIDFTGSGDVFAACDEVVIMSKDNGNSWSNMASITYPVSLRINSKDEIFVGTYASPCSAKVYYSTDGGIIWESGSQDLPAEFVCDLHFCKDGSILAATVSGGALCESCTAIFRTTDHAKTWSFSNDGIRTGDYMDYCFGHALAANSKDEIFVCTNKGIFISKDNGQSWQERNNGIYKEFDVAENMSDITVTPTDKIFAIGVANAYMSADGGENWVVNSDGLDKFSGFMLEYYITYSPDGYLYAGGKFGQVIFRSANPVNASAPEAMKSYTTKLNQNYPNPFNSITTITYSIPKDCLVRLKVFDTLGNEVSQLVNEFKKAGEYRVNFNAGNLSSGVYLYKLFAGEYSAGKKFILVK